MERVKFKQLSDVSQRVCADETPTSQCQAKPAAGISAQSPGQGCSRALGTVRPRLRKGDRKRHSSVTLQEFGDALICQSVRV